MKELCLSEILPDIKCTGCKLCKKRKIEKGLFIKKVTPSSTRMYFSDFEIFEKHFQNKPAK